MVSVLTISSTNALPLSPKPSDTLGESVTSCFVELCMWSIVTLLSNFPSVLLMSENSSPSKWRGVSNFLVRCGGPKGVTDGDTETGRKVTVE
ncbi:unnamed protein product [Pieris brassicae]|uniref:Uncharacterized protein n=1 Tax=Pieris brassicae TaxID=7116 RepID=A0A9P0TBB5_PIEBR|nr:unnamed protein product [Pieris brassicae]